MMEVHCGQTKYRENTLYQENERNLLKHLQVNKQRNRVDVPILAILTPCL